MSDMIVNNPALEARSAEIRNEQLQARRVRIDRMFVWLFLAQYIAGIFAAITISPYSWEGKVHTIHLHVWVEPGAEPESSSFRSFSRFSAQAQC